MDIFNAIITKYLYCVIIILSFTYCATNCNANSSVHASCFTLHHVYGSVLLHVPLYLMYLVFSFTSCSTLHHVAPVQSHVSLYLMFHFTLCIWFSFTSCSTLPHVPHGQSNHEFHYTSCNSCSVLSRVPLYLMYLMFGFISCSTLPHVPRVQFHHVPLYFM